MKPSCLAILVAALLSTAAVANPPQPAPDRPAASLSVPPLAHTSRTLANGARLHALRDPAASTVAAYVWYGVGQRDDPVGRGGFAHLFEHLMFKQTRNLPDGVSDFVSDIGGSANATTLFDSTVYTTSAPANQLEALLWMEGERLRNLVVDQANFDSERGVVREELRQRIFASPYGRILHLLLPAHSFDDHPYERPIGGTIAELDAATLADVRAFHEAYYRPDNAIFVVSGNFDQAKLDEWADEYLGSIPRPSGAIPRDDGVITERSAPKLIDAYAPNVPLPAIVFSWHAPPAANERAVAGLALVEAILTRGSSGLLNRKLVHELALATDVTHYNFNTVDGHAFALIATLAEGRDVDQAQGAFADVIAGLVERPVSDAVLRAAKNGILGDSLRNRETVGDRAWALGEGADLIGDPAAADRKLALIEAMTPADVQRIAAEWLAADKRVTIRYRDESLRPEGFTPAPGADIAAMGTVVPPPSRPPVTIASPAARVAPPEPGPAPPRVLPEIDERQLANGLGLVVARSTDLPLTTLQLVVDGGDSADPAGHAGLADIVAELILRGSAGRDADAIASAIGTLGGSIDADAGADATTVSLTVPSANARAAGALLAEIARAPEFPADEIEKARKRQQDAIAIAAKQPVQLALRTIPAIAFAGTAYEAVPTAASLSAIDRDDIVAAHRASWRPDNATLVVTGSLTPDQAAALADELFGDWNVTGAGAPELPTSPARYAPRVVAVDLSDAGQTAVIAMTPTGARAALDYPALSFANAILGGGSAGWLSEEIREKRGLTYGAGSLLMLNRDAGAAIAVSRTRNESALQVAELMVAQLARLQTEPFEQPLIANRAAFLDMAIANRTDTTAGFAGFLGSYIAAEAPLAEAKREMQGSEGLSEDRIKGAASLLAPDRASLLLVGDAGTWIDALRVRHPEVELIDAASVGMVE